MHTTTLTRKISHGEGKIDMSNVRSGEVRTIGIGRSGYPSLDNGSHKHNGRRGLVHNVKDADASSIVSEGKPLKRGGSSGYAAHEVNKCGFKSQVRVLYLPLKLPLDREVKWWDGGEGGGGSMVELLLKVALRYLLEHRGGTPDGQKKGRKGKEMEEKHFHDISGSAHRRSYNILTFAIDPAG
ncbi:hypothetical protein CsSME_00024949 [Camellia sinensis var. sinensis]